MIKAPKADPFTERTLAFYGPERNSRFPMKKGTSFAFHAQQVFLCFSAGEPLQLYSIHNSFLFLFFSAWEQKNCSIF